jgi:hypothetical protein
MVNIFLLFTSLSFRALLLNVEFNLIIVCIADNHMSGLKKYKRMLF